MKTFFRYLRHYAVWLAACLVLLFGQAMSDLSLPSLMSDIVNVGIQQGGIEETAPQALSLNAMTLMRTFMSQDDQKLADQQYTRIAAGSSQAADYKTKYPLVNTEDIYIRKSGATKQLGAAFGRAAMTFANFMKDYAQQSGQNTASSPTTEGLDKIDLSPLYKMQPLLNQMPPAAFDKARQSADQLDDSLLEQVGVVMVRQFYKELGVDTGKIRMDYIVRTGFLMVLLTLAGAVATILVSLISARIAADIARRMRRDVFTKVESFVNAEFDQFSTASLITRTTNDVTQVQMLLVMGIRMICYAPIMGVGGIIMAVNKSPSMSWIIAVAVLILIGLISIVFVVAMPKFKLVQKLVDRLNLVTREHLSGMMVIRAFGTQKFEENRFDKANKDLTSVHLFVNRVMVLMMPVMMLLLNGISLVIVWVGAHQIEAAAIQVGDMVAFTQYAIQIIFSFLMIAIMFIMVPRAVVSVSRIEEVLNTKPTILDPEAPKTLGDHPTGRIEFHNVSFRYAGAEDDVLHDISFRAEPGETTAFIGSTGSGKSTLINLIPRFYDVTKGKILIDGVDIRELSQHDLREMIGFIPQKGILFSGDIASNLRYGRRDATDQEIHLAAEIAQATEFVSSTPQGMNNPISQGGSNVSGGQKQRLAIARALVKKPPIFIFDDSFSALDFKTDASLRRALKEHTGQSTVLIVAQRVGTIMNAEQIIVLDEGRIVGKGRHKELLETCETYREIAASQMTKEELA
ncbi:MAG TPA: ABC transporter ATP-binding protein [Ruminococcaceae bacterium]|nr:ABC transporter ATP-binding protein [Oscillospiraceae bacterium]